MRTYDEIIADARPERAFSNMTSFEVWAPRWCWAPCVHDNDATETYCPILSVSIAMGVTPAEWTDVAGEIQNYECSEFEEGPDPDAPPPIVLQGPTPELPGQMDLFGGTA